MKSELDILRIAGQIGEMKSFMYMIVSVDIAKILLEVQITLEHYAKGRGRIAHY